MSQDPQASLFLVEQMPMTWNALVVEYTSRCTAKCAMCYQAAGPRGSDLIGDARLSTADVERILLEAVAVPALGPRFHLTGGEALLDTDQLFHLFRFARDLGFTEITTTTNGGWARTPGRAFELMTEARESGLTSAEISWDEWHRPYIDPEVLSESVRACARAGVKTHLRILSTRDHRYGEALGWLGSDALALADKISCAPLFPTGRAQNEIPRDQIYPNGDLSATCHASLNLTVNARGDLAPCCAGLDQLPEPLFGNIHEERLDVLVDRLDKNLLVRMIVFRGTSALVELLEESGETVSEQHTGICHRCWDILSSPKRVRAIEDALERRRSSALQAGAEWLKAEVI